MQALESDTAVIPFPASEGEAPTTKGNYEGVCFNAMKHGILSRYTVLAHEDELVGKNLADMARWLGLGQGRLDGLRRLPAEG